MERALYRRENGTWTELPSISTEGRIITYSDQAGYYRLGPKTIIVPEMTNLHPNYPNPFNPLTNIRYDIGLLDGLQQNVSISVCNMHGVIFVSFIQKQGRTFKRYKNISLFVACL